MPIENMREIQYKCASCGAADNVRLFDHEPIPPAINCWKCHAGMKRTVEEQFANNIGMFPIQEAKEGKGARLHR